jgi:hypothetical protein
MQGNGVIVGLGICGVVFGATSSAATLMTDFRLEVSLQRKCFCSSGRELIYTAQLHCNASCSLDYL